jgi:hypothetical protein
MGDLGRGILGWMMMCLVRRRDGLALDWVGGGLCLQGCLVEELWLPFLSFSLLVQRRWTKTSEEVVFVFSARDNLVSCEFT